MYFLLKTLRSFRSTFRHATFLMGELKTLRVMSEKLSFVPMLFFSLPEVSDATENIWDVYPLHLLMFMIHFKLSAGVCLVTLASEYRQVCFQRKLFKVCNRPQKQQQKKNVDSQTEKQGALLLHWHPALEIRGNMTSVTPVMVTAYCIQLWCSRTVKVYPEVFSLLAFGIVTGDCIEDTLVCLLLMFPYRETVNRGKRIFHVTNYLTC